MLLVDELSLGLAPMVVDSLMRLVARLRDELGLAVLLVEQNAAAALDVCERGYLMDKGTIRHRGTAAALREDQRLLERTLGVTADGIAEAP
jgi:branched-chain amino acid transport system ATP-binding protein